MKENMKELFYQWIGNFSMPKDIINYNKTSNPHLQQQIIESIIINRKHYKKVLENYYN